MLDIMKLSIVVADLEYKRILADFSKNDDEYLKLLKKYLFSYLGYRENQYYLSKIGCMSKEI